MTRIVYPSKPVRGLKRYLRLVATIRNWLEFLMRKVVKTDAPFQCVTRTGLRFPVHKEIMFIFKDIFLHEAYLCPGWLARLPERPVVIDIGANVGFFSLYALHLRPQARVISFEPAERNYRVLEDNRARAAGRNWTTRREAVGGTTRNVELVCAAGDDPSSSPSMHGKRRPGKKIEQVTCLSMTDVFDREEIDHCDWLKIDCEGAEYEIFYQTPKELFQRIRLISVEIDVLNGDSQGRDRLIQFIEELGYVVCLADDSVVYASREIEQHSDAGRSRVSQ